MVGTFHVVDVVTVLCSPSLCEARHGRRYDLCGGNKADSVLSVCRDLLLLYRGN